MSHKQNKESNHNIDELIMKMGNIGVKKAQKRNWDHGLPNVYEIDGSIVFSMPDGSISKQRPTPKK